MVVMSSCEEGRATQCIAGHLSTLLERLGQDVLGVLSQLDAIPESILHWPLPFFQGDSLFTRITHLFEESEFLIRAALLGQNMTHYVPKERSPEGLADLINCYARWSTTIHQLLDRLADSTLDLFVALPPCHRDGFGIGLTTVGDCLLYSLEQSISQAGHIQFVYQMLTDSEGFFHEVTR